MIKFIAFSNLKKRFFACKLLMIPVNFVKMYTIEFKNLRKVQINSVKNLFFKYEEEMYTLKDFVPSNFIKHSSS